MLFEDSYSLLSSKLPINLIVRLLMNNLSKTHCPDNVNKFFLFFWGIIEDFCFKYLRLNI
jgi:hypothetical protein